MEVKNIEKYFSHEILRRGYDYYKKGNVINIDNDRNIEIIYKFNFV